MKHKTKHILGIFLIIITAFSCNKINSDEIPSNLILVDDNYTLSQGETITLDFLNNDILEGNNISVSVFNETLSGTLTNIANTTKYNYKADFDFEGNESFVYQVCAGSNCKEGVVNFKINALADSCQPVANEDFISSVNEHAYASINWLLENDVNNCSEWDYNSFNITNHSTKGFIVVNGDNIIFTSTSTNWRKDQFEYEICTTEGNCKKGLHGKWFRFGFSCF